MEIDDVLNLMMKILGPLALIIGVMILLSTGYVIVARHDPASGRDIAVALGLAAVSIFCGVTFCRKQFGWFTRRD